MSDRLGYWFHRVNRWFVNHLPRKKCTRGQAKARRAFLTVETLEDRFAPAVYNVIGLADGVGMVTPTHTAGVFNATTLRAAISAANANPGGNTINLTVPGAYQITLPGAGVVNNSAGEFAIQPTGGNLTIQNASGGSVLVYGNHLARVFDINPNFNPATPTAPFTVTLTGFTISGGLASDPNNPDGPNASGGGIRDQGNAGLVLNNTVISGNSATADGGGISMENTISEPWKLTVNNSTISNNHAGDAGGGIEEDGSGKVFINAGTVITGNTCVNQGAGIWLDALDGVTSVTVTNPGTLTNYLFPPTVVFTSVDGKGVGAQGTPILSNGTTGELIGVNITNPGSGYDVAPTVTFNYPLTNNGVSAVATIAPTQTAALTVTGAVISNNQALNGPGGGIGNSGAGAVTIIGSTIENNSSAMDGGGFADQNNLGTLAVVNSVFLNNVAGGDGGGIQEGGPTTSITSSQIAGNASGATGGAIFANGATLFVQNSTIANNTAAGDPNTSRGGGGIELETSGTGFNASTITNTTITGNKAVNNGDVVGGGIDVRDTTVLGDLVLVNDTINANYAGEGGGVFWAGAGTLTVQNTLLAGNVSPEGVDAFINANGAGFGLFIDNGGNLIGVAGDDNSVFTAGTTQTGTLANPINPLLAPLGNYGGPTIGAPGATQVLVTEALQTGSPAVGKGVLFRAPAYDERGVMHLVNGAVNVGAVSAIVSLPPPATHVTASSPLVSHQTVNGVLTTTYLVNSTTDTHTPAAGTLTLRDAIDMANQTSGNKIIELLVAGDYAITLPGANTGTNASGAFAILPSGGNVTILNASGGAATVDGNHIDRVFDINPGDDTTSADKFTVTLQGITITNGIAQTGDGPAGSGGGIRDQGIASLTLTNDVVTGNIATADGGGISMENTVSVPWTLTINNSVISNNHAGDAGGGIEEDGSGKVFINAGTVITGNTSVNQGAGIWLDAIQVGNVFQSANLTVTDVLISNNHALAAGNDGGGIGNAGNGVVTIANSTLVSNVSDGMGGGFGDENAQGTLVVSNSFFLDNFAVGDGGGIEAAGPTTTLTNTEFRGNDSGLAGGGLFANGVTVTLKSTTFAVNVAAGDGQGLGGGAIELETTGTTSITDSTIAGNVALNNAGANGGGIDAPTTNTGNVSLLNDTINGNVATNGGGLFWGGAGGFALKNTILAQNVVGLGGVGPDADGSGTNFTDDGGNLIGLAGSANGNTGLGAAFGGLASTQVGTTSSLNPLLQALGNNGGPTVGDPSDSLVLETEPPAAGSSAIGKGIVAGAPPTDERGAPSVVNGKVNVGANSDPPTPKPSPIKPGRLA